MKYYKDTNNKPFAFEDNATDEVIANVAIKHNTELTAITLDEFKVLTTPPPPTLDEVKVSKLNEVTTAFDSATKQIADVLPHEMATWRTQEDEARAYVADNTVTTPMLSELIIARAMGETVADLAGKVIANADAYRTAYTPLLGKYQSLTNQVNLAATIDEVNLIAW